MKINNAGHVCDVLLPGERRPINKDFSLFGVSTLVCTVEFLRGNYGLKEDEYPGDYFIAGTSKWLSIYFECSPSRGMYRKTVKTRYSKDRPSNYKDLIKTIEEVCLKAILG